MFDVFFPKISWVNSPRLANSGDDIARAPTWKDTLKAAETGKNQTLEVLMGYSSWPNYCYIGYLYTNIFTWYVYMYMYMYSCRRPDAILSYTYWYILHVPYIYIYAHGQYMSIHVNTWIINSCRESTTSSGQGRAVLGQSQSLGQGAKGPWLNPAFVEQWRFPYVSHCGVYSLTS